MYIIFESVGQIILKKRVLQKFFNDMENFRILLTLWIIFKIV